MLLNIKGHGTTGLTFISLSILQNAYKAVVALNAVTDIAAMVFITDIPDW